MIEVRPLSGSIGAAVTGISLGDLGELGDLNDGRFSAIRDAFLANCMLVFPGQYLSVARFEAFSKLWGEPVTSSFLEYIEGHHGVSKLFNRGKSKSVTENWHSDTPFLPEPPSINLLSALHMPVGGDTMWCNQYLAYETLSSGMQQMLCGLKIEFNGDSLAGLTGRVEDFRSCHPVVRTHPETGRKSLFVGPPTITARRFEHMTEEESFPLLHWLHQHSFQPHRVYRHHWSDGDVVMWDNRCTLHYAVHDHGEDAERELYRITTRAEKPV